MKKQLMTGLFTVLALTAGAQTFQEWRNPEINAVNRAPMHTNYFAFENADAAKKADKKQSTNYMTLNGTWKFNWVKDADSRPTDFWKTGFNDKGWDDLQVPAVWELNGYGDPIYVNVGYAWRNQFQNNPPEVPTENNHVGSYRREIVVPASWKGKDIIAHFGSVTSNMYLWVNGRYVGYSEDSKLEAEFDLTPYLKPGQKNLIAFQVFRWCDGTYLEDQDFFRYSGVGRDCYLYARNKKRIQDIRVTPEESMQKVVWSDTIVNGGNIRNLTLPMPEALDGYYEDIVTYAIPLERQPEDTSLKPKVTFGNLKQAVIKDESKAVNRDEKGVFRSSYPCWIQYEYAEPVTCSNVEIILGGNNYQAHRLKVLASEDGRTFKTVKQLVPARQGWQNTDFQSTHAIPPVTARYFRFEWTPVGSEPGSEDLDAAKWKPNLKINDIVLHTAPRIHQWEGKAGLVWRVATATTSTEIPDAACVQPDELINLPLYQGRLTARLPEFLNSAWDIRQPDM